MGTSSHKGGEHDVVDFRAHGLGGDRAGNVAGVRDRNGEFHQVRVGGGCAAASLDASEGLMTSEQAAQFIGGVTARAVREMALRGELKCHRLGRKTIRFSRVDILQAGRLGGRT